VLYWKQALDMVDAATTGVRRTEATLVENRSVTLILRLVLCFAGILLMLTSREAPRVQLYGYDDSPWTLRRLWSWTIFVVPLLLSFRGVFSGFAAMTGIGNTAQSATGGNLVFTVICGAMTLGGWVLGTR
jgi:O-antigen/teichoic acid export membrane protein